jgi:hypothetical protein
VTVGVSSSLALAYWYERPVGEGGVVDRHLIETGKLKHLSTVEMLEKIPLLKRVRTEKGSTDHNGGAAERIIECAGRGLG